MLTGCQLKHAIWFKQVIILHVKNPDRDGKTDRDFLFV